MYKYIYAYDTAPASKCYSPGGEVACGWRRRELKTDDSEMAPQVVEIAQNGLEEGGLIAA
jgi:hypothetical protein